MMILQTSKTDAKNGGGRYEIALHGEIYVDKSQMISYLNSIISTPQRFISVSRPRRFGKTMAADMICAYYDRSINSHVLFDNKKLADICRYHYIPE